MRTGLCRECRGRGRPRKLHKDGPSPSPSTGGIIKRWRGRPRKEEDQQSQAAKHPPTPTVSTGEAAAEPPPTPLSTGGIIKRGRGRPRKEEQQSEATMPPPTPPASSRWGFKLGCGRPMLAPTSHLETHGGPPRPIIIENRLPPARWSVDPPAASASPRVKRPRGRPRMYRPMPVKTGDELENPRMHKPSAGDIVSMVMKRGCGSGREAKDRAAGL